MEKKKILLVEDEENLLNTIRLNLELENYLVTSAVTGIEALKEFRKDKFDIVILDVMLPEMSGFDVCEAIRLENNKIPVLFLTAKHTSEDRVKGLKLGADDYLTKPFNLEELLLRIQILLRRSIPAENDSSELNSFSFGGNEINFVTYQIKDSNGNIYDIAKRETALLKLLISRKGEVVSREEILTKLWGGDALPTSRTIDNYILAFRKYFEKSQREPKHFHSIRGVGYKFIE